MITWVTEKRKVSDLIPAEYNPRQMTEKQAQDLTTSLERFNLADPIVINTDNKIIGGHQRIAIYKLHGKLEVEVDVRIPSRLLTPEEEKELNIRLNKNLGEWDYDALANFDEEMLKDIGFDSKELDKIFQLEAKPKDDDVPEVRQTDIKTGDMFKLGEHVLLCADCTTEANVARLMGGLKADMVFTDPPYGISLDTDTAKILGKTAKAKVYDRIVGDGVQFDPKHIFDFFGYCKEILLWGADYYADKIPNRNEGAWLVWDKRVTGHEDKKNYASEFELCWSKEHRARRIFKHDWVRFFGMQKEDTKTRLHPNQKPVQLLIDIIPDGDVVVDLFGGSGSTLIACEKLNRKCRMMEIDPIYCQVIIDRWEKFTNQKAVKVQ